MSYTEEGEGPIRPVIVFIDDVAADTSSRMDSAGFTVQTQPNASRR